MIFLLKCWTFIINIAVNEHRVRDRLISLPQKQKQRGMERQINITHVTTLTKVGDQLVSKDFPIEQPNDGLCQHLHMMAEQEDYTMLDVQRYFHSHFQGDQMSTYKYCLPYDYSASYVKDIEVPEELTDDEYQQRLKEIKSRLQYVKSVRRLPRSQRSDEIDRLFAQSLKELKTNLADKYERYARAQALSDTISEVKEASGVCIYSREDRGWHTFNYKVDDNFVVSFGTNFGYGCASYFDITVKYNGIVLVPYSYIVNYYYANFCDIRRCTTRLRPHRELWDKALEYVRDLINEAQADPEAFIRTKVLNEVRIMVDGLKGIISNPAGELKRLTNKEELSEDYKVFRVIRPMTTMEESEYSLYPEEFVSAFKMEKVSGCLNYLNDLRGLSTICAELSTYADTVEEMNRQLYPEIKDLYKNVERTLKYLQRDIDRMEKRMDIIDHRVEYFEKKLDKALENVTFDQKDEVTRRFHAMHPRYASLLKTQLAQREALIQKRTQHSLRNDIYKRLSKSLVLEESYLKVA